jgi:peptidylamidoglycolate lyase
MRGVGAGVLALILSACAEQPTALTPDTSVPQIKAPVDTGIVVYQQVRDWPALGTELELGEVAGVDVDSHGHVFIFQRSTRGWNTENTTPIADPTVWVLDPATGRVLATWGAGQFLIPHGLTVDRRDNIWLTDASLHQAFRFSHDGRRLMVRGEANVARWDATHFNRPTDVAVRPDGGFYIADGYENSRVVQFGTDDRYLREWGATGTGPGDFVIPHSITARDDRVYVADRENDRVEVFDSAGAWLRSWSPVGRAHVYAVATDVDGSLLVGVRNDAIGIGGIVRLDEDGKVVQRIGGVPAGDANYLAVHDLAVGKDGAIYVAEVRNGGLRKLVPERIYGKALNRGRRGHGF